MRKRVIRYIFILLGSITLILGLCGIFTPGLPTTPLLLLTAFLYAKGSPRLHQKVLENKVTGHYIKRVNKGLSLKATLFSILFMWVMISFTVFVVFKNNETMQMIMVGLGIIGTVVQFIVLRKRKSNSAVSASEEDDEALE